MKKIYIESESHVSSLVSETVTMDVKCHSVVEERKVIQTRINVPSGICAVVTLQPADINYPEGNRKHRDTLLCNHNAMKCMREEVTFRSSLISGLDDVL